MAPIFSRRSSTRRGRGGTAMREHFSAWNTGTGQLVAPEAQVAQPGSPPRRPVHCMGSGTGGAAWSGSAATVTAAKGSKGSRMVASRAGTRSVGGSEQSTGTGWVGGG